MWRSCYKRPKKPTTPCEAQPRLEGWKLQATRHCKSDQNYIERLDIKNVPIQCSSSIMDYKNLIAMEQKLLGYESDISTLLATRKLVAILSDCVP